MSPYSALSSALNTSPTTSGVTVAGIKQQPERDAVEPDRRATAAARRRAAEHDSIATAPKVKTKC